MPSGVPLPRFPCVGRKTKSGEAAVGRRSWRTMAASATQNLGERGDTRSFSVYRRARPAVRSAGQERARQTRPCRLATSLSPARHRHRSLFFPARKKTVKKPTVARSIAIRQGLDPVQRSRQASGKNELRACVSGRLSSLSETQHGWYN